MLVEAYRPRAEANLHRKFSALQQAIKCRPAQSTTLKNFRDFDDTNCGHGTPVLVTHRLMRTGFYNQTYLLIFNSLTTNTARKNVTATTFSSKPPVVTITKIKFILFQAIVMTHIENCDQHITIYGNINVTVTILSSYICVK